MSTANAPDDLNQKRDKWLERLSSLMALIEEGAEQHGWSVRRIAKQMKNGQPVTYEAPSLILQFEFARVLVEPIAMDAPGTEGIVDLYLMPAYDDMASIYFYGEGWHIHYMFPGDPNVASIREAEGKQLSKETLVEVLDEIKKNAAQAR